MRIFLLTAIFQRPARAKRTHVVSGRSNSGLVEKDCAFANDVTVNGTVTWVPYGSFVADLTVSGSGTAGGTLHVEGTWQAPGPVGNFNVSGTLGGKQVAVLVPEA